MESELVKYLLAAKVFMGKEKRQGVLADLRKLRYALLTADFIVKTKEAKQAINHAQTIVRDAIIALDD